MAISHHRCTPESFLDNLENAPNGILVILGEDMYFAVQHGEDKQVYMAPDTRQYSTLEVMAFVADVKLVMARRTGRPGKMSFP